MMQQIIHPDDTVTLGNYYAMTQPTGWALEFSYNRLPVRLLDCGRVILRPSEAEQAFFTLQIVSWLDGQAEHDYFLELLKLDGAITADTLANLYPILLAVSHHYITYASVLDHAGIGRSLLIEYEVADLFEKGRVIYAPAPSGHADVFIASYEGKEPSYSSHMSEVQAALDSVRKNEFTEDIFGEDERAQISI